MEDEWVEVVTAPNETTAEMIKEMLTRDGIVARVQKDAPPFLGVSFIPCAVLVPERQLAAARKLIDNFEANDDNSPQEDPS